MVVAGARPACGKTNHEGHSSPKQSVCMRVCRGGRGRVGQEPAAARVCGGAALARGAEPMRAAATQETALQEVGRLGRGGTGLAVCGGAWCWWGGQGRERGQTQPQNRLAEHTVAGGGGANQTRKGARRSSQNITKRGRGGSARCSSHCSRQQSQYMEMCQGWRPLPQHMVASFVGCVAARARGPGVGVMGLTAMRSG